MTVAAGRVTTGPAAPAPSRAGASGPAEAPRLADGVELLGEYKNSGHGQPPSLVRRADGQVVQMSRLLYLVTRRIDGCRDPAAIAALVADELGRALNADQVRYLITAKLLPLGIVAAEGAPAAAPKANPLLALRARGTLLPEWAANAAGTLLRPLFRWPVVAAVAGTFLAVDYWLLAVHGLGSGLQQVLHNPVDLLIVLGLSVLSAAFHECGHAAGCPAPSGSPAHGSTTPSTSCGTSGTPGPGSARGPAGTRCCTPAKPSPCRGSPGLSSPARCASWPPGYATWESGPATGSPPTCRTSRRR